MRSALFCIWTMAIALSTAGDTRAELPKLERPEMTADADWPAVTSTSRPWTRWWWLGSAVDKPNITRQLEAAHDAGLGGVEITSIYGVRGAEDRELPFLSNAWVDAVRHTVEEAHRLGMQVDLPTGSGWRTGGPSVTDEDANTEVVIEREPLEGGSMYRWTFDQAPPQALVAYSGDGQIVDLGERIRDRVASGDMRHVEWEVPKGDWTLYTVTEKWSRDNVKRPAPGGEGKNINPLSQRSVRHFLNWFGEKLDGLPAVGIRAQFHDSYEYEGNWCDDFFAQFEKRRGYKLEHHLTALSGRGDSDEVARVKCDYRETVSDLVREEFIETWTNWSHEHNMLSRNQSHGSPANWLDLYATCDIPEIESFGRLQGGDTNRLVFKFASSAAHVTGQPLVSSETATWLNEHFTTTLAEVKEICDRLLLGGINHVFYHGMCYSPDDATWPGWLFYASMQLNPQNPIWRDFAALNEYVTRCQSMLQSSKPDNDVLVYWPIHDAWRNVRGLRMDIRVHNANQWFSGEFRRTAEWLDEHGYAFDYVSDRLLATCRAEGGKIRAPGGSYQAVIVPGAEYMPTATLQQLVKLVRGGATVIFLGSVPTGPPGLVADDEKSVWEELLDWQQAESGVPPASSAASQTAATISRIGQGRMIVSHDVLAALQAAGVRRESLTLGDTELKFHRRAWSGGNVYLAKNESNAAVDGWLALAADWNAAVIMDPLDGRVGKAAERDEETQDAAGVKRLRLQLEPGQTSFIKTYRDPIDAAAWVYRESTGAPTTIDGEWSIEFVAGGPELPPPVTTGRLVSWTELAGSDGERFAGTARYLIRFSPDVAADRYLLDLGEVANSARVELNGKPLATLIAPPYEVVLDDLLDGENELAVEVTNVAANRIRDMDQRGVRWRIFKDINFVNINYRQFDASDWPIRDAGLLGPVTLTPLSD